MHDIYAMQVQYSIFWYSYRHDDIYVDQWEVMYRDEFISSVTICVPLYIQ